MLHFTTGTRSAAWLLVSGQHRQQQAHAAPVGDAGKNKSRAHERSRIPPTEENAAVRKPKSLVADGADFQVRSFHPR